MKRLPSAWQHPRVWVLPGSMLIGLDALCLMLLAVGAQPGWLLKGLCWLLPPLHAALMGLAWWCWRSLHHEQQRLVDGINALDEGFVLCDPQDRLVLANPAFRALYPGLSERWQAGTPFEEMLHDVLDAGAVGTARGREQDWFRERLAQRSARDGKPWIEQLPGPRWIRLREQRASDGSFVGMRTDVTELMQTQQALATSEEQLQAIVSMAGAAILTIDPQGVLRSCNPAAARLFGTTPEQLLLQSIHALFDDSEQERLGVILQLADRNLVAVGQQWELNVHHRAQPLLTVQMSASPVRIGGRRQLVLVLTDLSERKRFETELRQANEQLLQISTTDALTELANRRLLMQRLDQEWRRARRSHEVLSLILIDVDHFKLYNDHYGHQAGDHCLRQVADILRRQCQRAGDLAARYGGEEFVLLLPGTALPGAQAVAQRCRDELHTAAMPHAHSPLSDRVTVSMGLVSGIPAVDSSAGQWLSVADAALYRAKAQGRDRVVTDGEGD